MEQVLNNINSIKVTAASNLSGIDIVAGEGVVLHDAPGFEALPLVGLARAEVTSTVENKSRTFKTVINALLCSHFDSQEKHLAFLLETVSGERFLTGTAEAPYPIVNTTDILPGQEKDYSGCSMTVEYTDIYGLLRVLG